MKKGFTLIELSIVLIIIGLLTGGAFQVLKMMNEKARATQAKDTLQSAKEAVIAFAINNNRLPTNTEFTNMNLMGPGNIALFYNSDAQLQTALCDTPTTPLSTVDPNGVTTANIGFVLAAAGENFNIQTGRTGDVVTFHPWNTQNIDDETTVLNRPEPYDDLYLFITLGELQSLADCQTNRFQIINTTLPVGTAGTPYPTLTPAVVTTGGTPACTTPPVAPCAYTVSGLPGNLAFNAATNTISGTPASANNYLLTFTATNGTATDTKSLLLVISAPIASDSGGGGSGTPTRQECLDACDAAGGSYWTIKKCKNKCPKK